MASIALKLPEQRAESNTTKRARIRFEWPRHRLTVPVGIETRSPAIDMDQVPCQGETREALKRRAAELQWFHAIDFGDFQSCGRQHDNIPKNETTYGAFDLLKDIDLEGQDCLDIGTFDGLLAFGLKLKGARNVTAVDSFERETFQLSRELLGLDIEYLPNVQSRNLVESVSGRRFDFIACNGIVYHMLFPLSAFLYNRLIIKRYGLFMVDTQIAAPKFKEPVLMLNTEADRCLREPSTYFLPNPAAVLGMMKLACFDVLAVRHHKKRSRMTVLGRAVAPSEVRGRTELCQVIHERDFSDHEFQLSDVGFDSEPTSEILYRGPEGEKTIDTKKYVPCFPPHPADSLRNQGIGASKWLGRNGNAALRAAGLG